MADIFISYKSEDRERARHVAVALQGEGFDVWWDPALQAGEDYQEVIDTNLRESLVVVVLWSPRSVKSRWVRSEATIGDRYGALAPCMIEPCDLPTAFVLVQTVDLSHWRGEANDPKWREFVTEVANKRDKRRALRATNSPAAAAPDANQIESLFWQTIKDSTEPADFRSYMKRYPQGHFHDLAENRLKTLTGARMQAYTPPAEEPPPKKPIGAAAILGVAFLALVGVFGIGIIFSTRSLNGGTAAAGADPAVPAVAFPGAGDLQGKWGPAGLGCEYALTIQVNVDQLSFSDGTSADIGGVEPNGALRISGADGGTYFYSVKGDKLTIRSPNGDSASFTKCAS